MDRFGSSLFRIVWASICLLLTGLVLGAFQGLKDGQLVVFGTGVPMFSFGDPLDVMRNQLGRLIYALVPAIFLLGSFYPLTEMVAASSRVDRFKGLFTGLLWAVFNGLFLTQLAVLPVLVASYRIFGSFEPVVLQANLNALVLGLQLLLWTTALAQLLKSNRGISLFLAFALAAVGKLFVWVTEFGVDLGMPSWGLKLSLAIARLLPTEMLPNDPLAWSALPLSFGGPLALAMLLMLLPARAAKSKRSKA